MLRWFLACWQKRREPLSVSDWKLYAPVQTQYIQSKIQRSLSRKDFVKTINHRTVRDADYHCEVLLNIRPELSVYMFFNLQLNLQQFHKLRDILLTQCHTDGYPGTCGWLNDWVAPCFCLFLSVMRRGTRRAGSPLRVRWWAGTLWWLLMSGEHPEPLGWKLAGCRVCPDGVSSGPCYPPSLHTMG